MNINVDPVVIDGKEYYTVKDFSSIVKKSDKVVYALISKGNAIRKLKTRHILGKPLIEANEATEYIFTGPGRFPLRDLYRYDEVGNAVPVDPNTLKEIDQ